MQYKLSYPSFYVQEYLCMCFLTSKNDCVVRFGKNRIEVWNSRVFRTASVFVCRKIPQFKSVDIAVQIVKKFMRPKRVFPGSPSTDKLWTGDGFLGRERKFKEFGYWQVNEDPQMAPHLVVWMGIKKCTQYSLLKGK